MIHPKRLWSARLAVLAVSCFAVSFHARSADCQEPPQVDILELEEQAFEYAVQRAGPSVVRIETFGGLEKVGNVTIADGPTTGVLVSADGYVVSSSFNFIQKPASILVTLPNGKRVAAEVANRDESRHLILLKVNSPDPLPVPVIVPRKEILVGQWSLALGRTFSRDSPNLSVGVISATNRIWGKAIQTDAKISPANYGGALVDIEGRIMGVLVPMSPQGNSEMAGAEWYDSGIGFAVPLEDITSRLDRLRTGEPLKPGLLGVAFKGRDMYKDPAEITLVRVNSPAETAGFQPGDIIIGCNEQAVARQAQLRHAIGPLYAEDEVQFTVKRGDQELELSAVLAAEIPPYERPFAGVLPMRDSAMVRFVYPDSPAAAAGIQPGDQLIVVNEEPVGSFEELTTKLRRVEPGSDVAVKIKRGDEEIDVLLTIGSQPGSLPTVELPSAYSDNPDDAAAPPADDAADDDAAKDEDDKAESDPAEGEEAPKPNEDGKLDAAKPEGTGRVEIKIPEVANKCEAFVPAAYRPERPAALLVYLHATGSARQADPLKEFEVVAEKYQTIVVCPQSSNERAWRATDAEFVRKVIDQMIKDYTIDDSRVVVVGRQSGGAIAYLTAFANAEVVRGVAPIEVGIPQRVQVPATDPVNPIYIATSEATGKPAADAVKASIEKLAKAKFPVTIIPELDDFGNWGEAALAPLFIWLDTLDRI